MYCSLCCAQYNINVSIDQLKKKHINLKLLYKVQVEVITICGLNIIQLNK